MTADNPLIVILSGPTRAGKNTVAGRTSTANPALRYCRRGRIAEHGVSTAQSPLGRGGRPVSAALRRKENACRLARSFVEAHFAVLVLDVLSDETARIYRTELEDYTPRIVLLLPSLDEIKRRSADFGPRLTEEETLWTYEEAMRLSVYDERIDNTGLTPEEVAIKLARGWNP